MALAIGSVISFASMLMASQVGEPQALQLHVTELLMLLGTTIVWLVERPAEALIGHGVGSEALAAQQPEFADNR
jgi:hypothetical protein